MKTSIKLMVCALFLSSIVNAQNWNGKKIKGNGVQKTENRSTTNYDEVKVSGFFDVDLIAGNEGKISVQAEENLLQYIKIEVENNILKIYTEKGINLQPTKWKAIKIIVPFESLNAVSLSGSGDVKSKATIKTNQFSANLSGSGDLNLQIDAQDIEAKLSGSGDISLTGNTSNFSTVISGSGDITAYDLEAKNVDVVVSGSGDVKVFCTENLKVRVSGSGDITYKGEPKTKDTKVSGSGNISKD